MLKIEGRLVENLFCIVIIVVITVNYKFTKNWKRLTV